MKIWVDADACPAVIKEILFRAAERSQVTTTLVANHSLRIPPSRFIHFLQVTKGFDVADNAIVQRMSAGDLVVTADIPLAAEVIEKGGTALNPRGELYTPSNIRARLNMRDFMESLRSSGVDTGGPSSMSQNDRQAFANQLDRLLTQYTKKLDQTKRDAL
ncbi:YaiI/YqxD family protein [Thiomicrorhabdus sp. ZW0627]|uniref:YaiI/YqxD family protein n=1 Tax=Thiomicrorhabdus sp. ZW0627 TaxID=3039774 RepID=UPI0024373998|nr:YaiI/YqxD family protein [Thiomicrorhabdus sp. ZW0627]MDG6772746.1 YaiI/YqxD family protein [Thiomicrorhabdus sp. ZW0627]